MTRDEHLAWCKTRALEILAGGDRNGAFASMISDLGKHRELVDSARMLAPLGMFEVVHGSELGLRRWIEGFN